MSQFKDHFSQHAAAYAEFRPQSPKELFKYLASLVSDHSLAWDVGTGNGQAALELAPYFDKILATDASADQIGNAVPNPKIEYRVASAENSGIAEPKVSLTTIAQAIHWFNFDAFYNEVKRVSTKGAVIAAWTYDLAKISPEIDEIVSEYYDGALKGYWPAERKLVDEHYQTIPFPFKEISAPSFDMQQERTLEQWCGYIFTWSGTQRAVKALGPAVFDSFVAKMEKVWGPPGSSRTVSWPLHTRIGRVLS